MTIGQHVTGGVAPAPGSGRPQVAVVGAGVVGLTAAYLLQRRYDVTLYEAQDRLGGHAHTHEAPTAEQDVLGAFRYNSSEVVLHTDAAVLPRAPAARASWNYLLRDCTATAASVHVSYHLNRLQGLDEATDYLVTLNARDRVRPGSGPVLAASVTGKAPADHPRPAHHV